MIDNMRRPPPNHTHRSKRHRTVARQPCWTPSCVHLSTSQTVDTPIVILATRISYPNMIGYRNCCYIIRLPDYQFYHTFDY